MKLFFVVGSFRSWLVILLVWGVFLATLLNEVSSSLLSSPSDSHSRYSRHLNSNGRNIKDDVLILMTLEGRPSQLENQEFDFLEELIRDTYNDLTEAKCPTSSTSRFATMLNITFDFDDVESYGSEPRIITGTTDFTLILEGVLECGTDCNLSTLTTFADGVQRRTLQRRPQRRRKLSTSSNTCVPTEEEFVAAMVAAMQLYKDETQLDGLDKVLDATELEHYSDETFASCADPNTRDDFAYHTTVAVQGNWAGATPEQVQKLEMIAIDVYNEINVLNPNLCDGESRVVNSASIEIYNEQGVQFNPTSGRLLLQDGDDEQEGSLLDSPQRQRRSLNSNWWYLKIGKGGTCYGCPKNGCLTNDVSGNSKSTCTFRSSKTQSNGRELTTASGTSGSNYMASCFCPRNAPRTLPTTTDYVNELNSAIQLLRNEPGFNFDFVTTVVYATEQDSIPNTCCGYPVDDFIKLPQDVDLHAAITEFLIDPYESDYGFHLNCWDVSQVTDFSWAFSELQNFNEELDCWDTSSATDMEGMFYYAASFDQDISNWDTSQVTNMNSMFENAVLFNQNIGGWDTSSVTSMEAIFESAWAFDKDISAWDTSLVTSMEYAFFDARTFNQNLNDWDVSKVQSMHSMFANAAAMDQGLNDWDTGSCEDMSYMFFGATAFNGDITSWNTERVWSMEGMFDNAVNFDQDIGSYDTSSVETMCSLFSGAKKFNQDLHLWNVELVRDMSHMFSEATAFNGNIESWHTAALNNTRSMFFDAVNFDRDISNWHMNKVRDFSEMFESATAFNADIGGWNVHRARDMSYMFLDATNFNVALDQWDISRVCDTTSMFDGASSFAQDLCDWKHIDDNLEHATDMFAGSACPEQDDPDFGIGPYCEEC